MKTICWPGLCPGPRWESLQRSGYRPPSCPPAQEPHSRDLGISGLATILTPPPTFNSAVAGGFGNSLRIRMPDDLRLNGCLDGVLRSPNASILVFVCLHYSRFLSAESHGFVQSQDGKTTTIHCTMSNSLNTSHDDTIGL